MPITETTILPLEYGHFKIAYHKQDDGYCISVSYGDLKNKVPIVRLHSSCLFSEAFQGLSMRLRSTTHFDIETYQKE